MPIIYLISQNDSNVQGLKSSLVNFPSIRPVIINATLVKVAIREYAKKVAAEDLIIVDSTGDSTPEATLAALEWATEQKQTTGVRILFVAPAGTSPPVTVDAVMSAESLCAPDGVREVIQLVYRKFTLAGARLSEDSVEVLKLMGSRSKSLLVNELYHSAIIDNPKISFDEFALAQRLTSQLSPLLWVSLTDSLASIGKCEFSHLGSFERSYGIGGELTIAYKSDSHFANGFVPEMEFNVTLLQKEIVLPIKACFPYLPARLHEFVSTSAIGEFNNSSFAHMLCEVFRTLLDNFQEYQPNSPVSHMRSAEDYEQPWIHVFGQAAAFASYFFKLSGLSQALVIQKQFSVPMIGKFSMAAKGAVTFIPSTELLQIIKANPLSKAISN
jgi:hypothetical protein